MARPRLLPGTAGTPTLTKQVTDTDGRWITAPEDVKPTRWRARVKVRDVDGQVRDVERVAATKGKAQTALKAALRDRSAPAQGDLLRPDMTLAAAGEIWLTQIQREDAGIKASTRADYLWAWGRYLGSAPFAQFTLAEANRVPRIRTFLQGVADSHGSGAAKTARTVLSNVLGLALDDGVIEVNAAKAVRPAKRSTVAVRALSARQKALGERGFTITEMEADHDRAFTEAERATVVAKIRADSETSGMVRRADVADLVAFLAAVGARIDEAMSVRWEGVDFKAGTVYVPGTKTETSDRTLSVASWAMDVLHARWRLEGCPTDGYVFHGPHGGLEDRRDLRNVARALRKVLDDAGHPWAIPHTFRRTVATLLDQRGVPLAQIADYLGHADPSMTARRYLGRRPHDTRNAAANL